MNEHTADHSHPETGNHPLLQVQQLNSESPELTEDLIERFANTFRYIFANPPYGQYLFYPSKKAPISPQEVFAVSDDYIDLETLDSFQPSDFPTDPESGEQAIFWQDPETVFTKFQQKLTRNAFLRVLTSNNEELLVGATIGYRATLQEVFTNEEWENPFSYSTRAEPKEFRSLKTFLQLINEHLSDDQRLTEDSEVFCHNCIFIHPAWQKKKLGWQLERDFFDQLPDEILQLPIIAEALIGSQVHQLGTQKGKALSVAGFFTEQQQDENRVILIGKGSDYKKALHELMPSSSSTSS